MPDELPSAGQTQRHLQQLTAGRHIRPSSRLGQNFLIDLNLQRLLVEAAELDANDVVLEIGAGTGSLTAQLAARAGHVVAVEVDLRLFELASEALQACGNVTLLHADALRHKNRLNPEILDGVRDRLQADGGRHLKMVANLPYQVATPVIANLLGEPLPLVSLTVTIQQELAERLAARPSTPDYGALSIWVQALSQVRALRRVPPSAFWPRPAVNSAMVQIVPDALLSERIADPPRFHEFVKRMFLHRRKTLANTLVSEYPDRFTKASAAEFLAEHGVAANARPEELPVERWIALSNDLIKT